MWTGQVAEPGASASYIAVQKLVGSVLRMAAAVTVAGMGAQYGAKPLVAVGGLCCTGLSFALAALPGPREQGRGKDAAKTE